MRFPGFTILTLLRASIARLNATTGYLLEAFNDYCRLIAIVHINFEAQPVDPTLPVSISRTPKIFRQCLSRYVPSGDN